MRCDGLVVATPAGSTGYNLANGGPVMAWGVEGFVVSFIAPHSLTARALVVAPGDVLDDPQPLARGAGRRDRRRPAGRRARAGRAASRRGSCDGQGRSRRSPGATFYQRLREKFGRLATRDCVSRRRGRADIAAPIAGSRSVGHRLVHRDAMLHELRVENLLLIERAELRLGAGPERAHGRDRRRQDAARPRARPAARRPRRAAGSCAPGAAEAYVEGVFALPDGARRERSASGCPSDAEELVLARRVWPDGRTRAYVCGRSATVARPARARRPRCSPSTASTSTAS